jgi:CP family cyanate transporter-like MFS transporter
LRRTPLLVALFLAAVALRPQLVGVGPLLPSIQTDLGVSHAVAGLLGTIPVLCMGLFAPPAPFLSGRIGSRRAIGAALSLVGVFGVARAVVPGAAGVVLLTFPLGMGMGLAGAMLPVAVKERFSDRPGFATGVYTAGITVGAAIAAAVAVPLAHAANGWRTPLLVFGAVSTALAALWLWLTRSETGHVRTDVRPLRRCQQPARVDLSRRSSCVVRLCGLNSWLPRRVRRTRLEPERGGGLLAVLNTITIPSASFRCVGGRPSDASRVGSPIAAALQLASLLGVVLAAGRGWLWAVLLGM